MDWQAGDVAGGVACGVGRGVGWSGVEWSGLGWGGVGGGEGHQDWWEVAGWSGEGAIRAVCACVRRGVRRCVSQRPQLRAARPPT